MTKMRIQLKDVKGVIQSDRLVEQQNELIAGPKGIHKGHITLELTLQSLADIELFKNYIDQLAGTLPLKTITKYINPNVEVNPYREIYQDVKSKANMEEVIDYLQGLDFRFVTKQFIEERVDLGKLDKEYNKLSSKYQYLVRLSRVAKDPIYDRYDFTLIFGIDLYKQGNKIYVYREAKKFKRLTSKWLTSQANMKKKKIPLQFPQFMTIEERTRWRKIHRGFKDKKDISQKDTKFYSRYKPDIKNLEFE